MLFATLSKALGTRHRAGVGISEVTDSLTVIVSEESGKVSVAYGGELFNGLTQEGLREKLELIQDKPVEESKRSISSIIKRKSETEKNYALLDELSSENEKNYTLFYETS